MDRKFCPTATTSLHFTSDSVQCILHLRTRQTALSAYYNWGLTDSVQCVLQLRTRQTALSPYYNWGLDKQRSVRTTTEDSTDSAQCVLQLRTRQTAFRAFSTISYYNGQLTVNEILYPIVISYFYFKKYDKIMEIIIYLIICAKNLSINVKISLSIFSFKNKELRIKHYSQYYTGKLILLLQ